MVRAPETASLVSSAEGRLRISASLADDSSASLTVPVANFVNSFSYSPTASTVLLAMIQKIGLQMMVSYRVMRFFRGIGWTLMAKVLSRRIRRVYGAEIHWDTDLAPGVMIVHGTGLVLSHAARVGPRCILFQHVTLGESMHAETREVGAPILEADVHVGPGATLLGPITIGRGTKITAGALVMQSVPAMSLVETPAATVRSRARPA